MYISSVSTCDVGLAIQVRYALHGEPFMKVMVCARRRLCASPDGLNHTDKATNATLFLLGTPREEKKEDNKQLGT